MSDEPGGNWREARFKGFSTRNLVPGDSWGEEKLGKSIYVKFIT